MIPIRPVEHNIRKNIPLRFFFNPANILRYEKIQDFSSDDLNSTLCHAALLLSCGQKTALILPLFVILSCVVPT